MCMFEEGQEDLDAGLWNEKEDSMCCILDTSEVEGKKEIGCEDGRVRCEQGREKSLDLLEVEE